MTKPFADLPELYRLSLRQRSALSTQDLDALWAAYVEFWRGHEGHQNRIDSLDEDERADSLRGHWGE
jgi:hypothetical protein